MANVTAILTSNEKVIDENLSTSEEFLLDRNIKLTYKDNKQLFEDSIVNLLNVHSRDELIKLYNSSKTSLETNLKLNEFKLFKKEITQAAYDKQKVSQDVLFHVFALKIANVVVSKIKSTDEFKKNKFVLANEDQFFDHICFQVQSIVLKTSYRTLVLDFNLCLEKNEIKGETKEEQYFQYNHYYLSSETYLNDFFELYPGLLRVLHSEVRKLKTFIVDVISQYSKDREEVNEQLTSSKECKKIEALVLGLGDSHSDGKRVAKLILENNYTVIYKPRDLQIDKMYRTISSMINESLEEDYLIRTPKVILQNGYGWAEFIPYEECKSKKEVTQFYKRTGAQLALLYALNAIDFHSENLIANGSFPVLIDLESLFHMPYKELEISDAYDKAQQKLASSVKSIGLLPFIFGSNHVDVSGIGQKGEVQTFIKVPKIKLEKDSVKVEREYGKMEAALNHPKLEGNYVNANDYILDIKDGFSRVYNLIQEHRNRVLHIIKESAEGVFVRFIPKPTVRYASFLELSLHPRFLHNYIDREVFLAKIWEDTESNNFYKDLAPYEFNDLINDDIPIFSQLLLSRDLYSSKKEKIVDFFDQTPLEMITKKIENFDCYDLEFQKKLIELSILSTNSRPLNNPKPKKLDQYNVEMDHKDFFIKKAEAFAEKLYGQSLTGDHNGKRNYSWINSTPVGVDEIHWSHAPMGDSLYNGLSGMAMMYLSLWIVTKKVEYLNIGIEIVEDLLTRILEWENSNKDKLISVGAFTGISSYIYVLMNYYVATNDHTFKNAAVELAEKIPYLLEKDKVYDIIDGAAGAIVVLVSSYEYTNDDFFLQIAEICADHLISSSIENDEEEISWIGISENPLTGFSHGNAGYIYALSVLNKYTNKDSVTRVISKGLKFENNLMLKNGWLDQRMDNQQVSAASWCHGSPGILLSRLELSTNSDTEISMQATKDVQYALENILEDGFGREHSLCHGDIGNAMVLIEYGRSTENKEYINLGMNLLNESILRGDQEGFKCGVGNGAESPNLMIGLAGLVYGLLYACDARVPLLLDLKIGENIPQKGA